jgi:hypothetical protein
LVTDAEEEAVAAIATTTRTTSGARANGMRFLTVASLV